MLTLTDFDVLEQAVSITPQKAIIAIFLMDNIFSLPLKNTSTRPMTSGERYYGLVLIASFSTRSRNFCPTLKTTTRLSEMVTSSPVFGFRPGRAGFSRS